MFPVLPPRFRLHLSRFRNPIGSNTPEQVVSTPAVVEDEIEITRGESVTFASRYAAKLKIEVDGHEPLVVEGREYVYTPEEEAIVTVTPIGADGKEYAEMSLMVMISFKAAPPRGEVTFDPADGTALFARQQSDCCLRECRQDFLHGRRRRSRIDRGQLYCRSDNQRGMHPYSLGRECRRQRVNAPMLPTPSRKPTNMCSSTMCPT